MSIDIRLAQSIPVNLPKLSKCDIYVTVNAAVEYETQRQTKGVRRT